MSTLQAAAQQALEALDGLYLPGELERVNAAITALRAALAEPEEKPWRCACGANLYIDDNGAPRSKA